MGVITISLDDSVEVKLRKLAKGKGALGKAISEATKQWLEDQHQEALKRRFREIMQKPRRLGKMLFKTREELHDR